MEYSTINYEWRKDCISLSNNMQVTSNGQGSYIRYVLNENRTKFRQWPSTAKYVRVLSENYPIREVASDSVQSHSSHILRILTKKYHYKTKITFNWSNVMSCTLHGLKANIVHLMNMSQHKRFACVNWEMWRNDYIISFGLTTNHTNARSKVVCCGTQNHVITPSSILFHVY